jgi:hypothetical protein
MFYAKNRGAPKGQETLVSRYVSAEYYQRYCDMTFKPHGNTTFGYAAGKTAEMFNEWTDGWHLTNTTRLIWANG